MSNSVAEYRQVRTNLGGYLKQTARIPEVQREAAYYLAHIREIKTVDDLVGNPRLFRFAMTAFGMADLIYAKAFMRKALEDGIDRRDSFANRLADGRFRSFVEVFNFARHGTATTAFDRTQQGTVDRYFRQKLESDVRGRDEGAALALYFERMVPDVKSIYGILADRALITVVQTALGIPAATSALDIDRQAAAIGARLDLDDLKDQAKLQRFMERFATRWQAAHPTSAIATVPALFSNVRLRGLDADLIASLQQINRR